jgi:hypothetical protein
LYRHEPIVGCMNVRHNHVDCPSANIPLEEWCDVCRLAGPTDTCPDHGEQSVVRTAATGGPDPYAINVLACGHSVMSFGPGEVNVIVRTPRLREP